MPHQQYLKVFCFKSLGLLTLIKLWLPLFVNFSTSSFKTLNSLAFQISIFEYSICYLLHITKFPINIFVALLSNYSFSTSFQQTLLQSCSDLFLNFCFHYSLNKIPSFSGFLMYIKIKLRNVLFWHKWLCLVYASKIKLINSVKKFETFLLVVPCKL